MSATTYERIMKLQATVTVLLFKNALFYSHMEAIDLIFGDLSDI